MLMTSGPVPVPMEESIFSAKFMLGMISYWTSMSGFAFMNSAIAALFWSTIGGGGGVQNLICTFSWALTAGMPRVATPRTIGAAASPWAKRRRERPVGRTSIDPSVDERCVVI